MNTPTRIAMRRIFLARARKLEADAAACQTGSADARNFRAMASHVRRHADLIARATK